MAHFLLCFDAAQRIKYLHIGPYVWRCVELTITFLTSDSKIRRLHTVKPYERVTSQINSVRTKRKEKS